MTEPLTLSQSMRVAIAMTGHLTLGREAAITLLRIVEREEQAREVLRDLDVIRASYKARADRIERAYERSLLAIWVAVLAACALVVIG